MASSSEKITFPAEPCDVTIEINPDCFRPNRVSSAFARALPKNLDNLIADDIGSGTGVLAIIEANRGAKEVRAIEPAPANYELLVRNTSVHKQIKTYQGEYFDPIKNFPRAHIITADVSGIPEVIGRALGWYVEGIDTGGEKGSEITCELLRRAPNYIRDDGKLYLQKNWNNGNRLQL